jgi:NAD(P)-dependent dehydrogenase (short-subunit alcohol dehydrogenase family)
MSKFSFDGQVAIVTGAAGGIGQAIASELALRGARIVVNDYGGDTAGVGGSADRAEAAAAGIRSLGAEAVADCNPVGTTESARAIVDTAMRAFGRVDILVNNAGIALPGLITDHTDEQVDAVFRVNLFGPYALARTVWPVMREQGYGRILNTSSNSAFGLGANASYSTTKAGLIGLTLDSAIEGKPHGILVNAMMPVALSRMIEQIPSPDFVAWFRRYFPASKVARSIVPLLARECTTTGRIYVAGGGRLARVAFAEARGWVNPDITAELAAAHFGQAEDMTDAVILDDHFGSMNLLHESFPFEANAPQLDQDTVVASRPSDSSGAPRK